MIGGGSPGRGGEVDVVEGDEAADEQSSFLHLFLITRCQQRSVSNNGHTTGTIETF